MFQIFKNFITYFLILLVYDCTCRLPIDREKKVNEEIALFAEFENMIPNTAERYEFKSKLKVLANRAIKAEDDVVVLLEDRGALKNKMQIQSNALWYERIRSAIEKFEYDLAKNANVPFPTYKDEKDSNIRKRIFRERIWKWIFANKPDDRRVKTLVAKITASNDVTSTDEFSELIALAFSQISEYIRREVLRPDSGNFHVRFATTDPKVNRAVELFMDLFEIRDDVAVSKQNS